MASPSRYAGIPGFDVGTDDAPTPSTPPPERSLVENHELVTDLARYSETLCSESAIRKKWRLSEDTWKMLGQQRRAGPSNRGRKDAANPLGSNKA